MGEDGEKLDWSVLLGSKNDGPPAELVVTTSAAERENSTVGMGGDWNEFSLLTNRDLEDAIRRKRFTIKIAAGRTSDNGAKLLADLKRLEDEMEHRKRRLQQGQKIDSGTKKPRTGSQTDDNDSDCCPMREKPEGRDNTRVTSFPQLAKVVEEMQISVTKMQSQVDKLSEQVDKLTEEVSLTRMQQNPVDKPTEQVGGFAQCLKAYDDHFAAIRRQLDCYFPCPPRPQ